MLNLHPLYKKYERWCSVEVKLFIEIEFKKLKIPRVEPVFARSGRS